MKGLKLNLIWVISILLLVGCQRQQERTVEVIQPTPVIEKAIEQLKEERTKEVTQSEKEEASTTSSNHSQEKLHERKGLLYKAEGALYWMDINKQQKVKLYDIDIVSDYHYDEREKAIYFSHNSKLYKGDLEGTSTTLITEGVESWEYIEDEGTGEGWFLCENSNKGQKLVSTEGELGPKLPNKRIGNLFINERIFIFTYDLGMKSYYGKINEEEALIYQLDTKGNISVLIDFHDYYKSIRGRFDADAEAGRMSSIVAFMDGQLYFTVSDYRCYIGELFVYDFNTGQVLSIYKIESGFDPSLYVEVEEEYIYTMYTEVRHSYVYKQLDRKTFEEVDYGKKVGEDEKAIYTLKHDGIYSLDKKTRKSNRITEVYLMFWYEDYKSNWAYQVGDVIYFNDYSTYPSEEQYNQRKEMKDTIYKINLTTQKREEAPDELRYIISYGFQENKVVDAEGYMYFIANENEQCTILRYKDQVEEVAKVEGTYVSSLMVIK